MKNNKKGIYISGESGVIPLALQKLLQSNKDYYVVNDQKNDPFSIKHLKEHRSFEVREKELDFTDRNLLFSNELEEMWKNTDIIIHSGAYVGTDYCAVEPHKTIEVNVTGTSNLLEIAKKYNIKFVYFSTTAIFDPNNYASSLQITENTKIRPKTLYGITKYAGEQIIDRLYDKEQIMIIRPVFGFSDYPDDLHSALTKFLYVYHNNFINKNDSINLNILLDPLIGKNYTRVENIAQCVVDLIKNNAWGEKINVGDSYVDRKNWYQMLEIINRISKLNDIFINNLNSITFRKKEDYLHWHNIDNSKLLKLIEKNHISEIDNYISFEQGIEKVLKSLELNGDHKPYWI